MIDESFKQWLQARMQRRCHRQLIVLNCSEDSLHNNLNKLTECLNHYYQSILTVGFAQDESAPYALKYYKKHLGRNYDIVIYNAYIGVKPSAMLALEGCVNRGGLFIIVAPPSAQWSAHEAKVRGISFSYSDKHTHSPYIQRLQRFFDDNKDDNKVVHLADDTERLPISIVSDKQIHELQQYSASNSAAQWQLNQEQQNIHDNILSNASAADLLSVITAKRGRGKSTLLGVIAASISQSADNNHKNILLTAPTQANCQVVNQVFSELIPASKLRFIAPDQLLNHQADNSMLIIDEAAALAPEVIKQALQHFSHIIMATTRIGYEGSGLGFTHKVLPLLRTHYPHCQEYTLHMPLRWYPHDPLEKLFEQSFAPYTAENETRTPSSELTVRSVNSDELLDDPDLLLQVFSILISAHYQTTPDDLMRMMDASDHKLYIAADAQRQVFAACIVVDETTVLDESLAQQIMRAMRRLPGIISLQTLCTLLYDQSVLSSKVWRISRIAVLPMHQQNRLGSTLINHVKTQAINDKIDMLSTSFGFSSSLLNFWQKHEFVEIKRGNKVDIASGQVSVVLAHAFNQKAQVYLEQAKTIATADNATLHGVYDGPLLNNDKNKLIDIIKGELTLLHCAPSVLRLAHIHQQQEIIDRVNLYSTKGTSKADKADLQQKIIADIKPYLPST